MLPIFLTITVLPAHLLISFLSQRVSSDAIHCSDRQTIDQLYHVLSKPALEKTLSIIANREVAQEIVHDVFIKLWQKAHVFPDNKAVYAWIYKACTHASIDYLRSSKVKSEKSTTDDLDSIASTSLKIDDQLIRKSEWLRLIKRLSETEASVLIYTVLDDMPQDEISELLKISRRTVQRAWLSAKEKVRRNL